MTDGGRSYRGASATERHADRRERLIRAAITVYGERGYRQATVNAVCREAGLTPRYFYEGFENSEALLAAAFRAVMAFVIAELQAAGARCSGGPVEKMRAMLGAYYDLLRNDPAGARVFLIEIAGVSPAIDALFAESLESFAELVTSTLDPEREARGRVDPLLRSGATFGLLHVARSWIAGGCKGSVGKVVDAALPLCRLLATGG